MTMAKRKLSTGGNIYFTLDNYGRRKAHRFDPGGPLEIADMDVGDPGMVDMGMDASDLEPLDYPDTDENLNFGQKLKKFGQENGETITDTLGGLGLGIGAISQRRYNRKHNLLKAAGVTNYRGKYTFGNGGNLFADGGAVAGGIAQGIGSAGSIAALTAQNASIADTSELEGAIQDKANVQVTAGSNDDLMSEWASRGPELKHVSWKDVRGQSAGKSFGNIMSAGAAGAKAGMKAGPIGAVAGAVGGIFSSTIGAIVGRRKAKKKAKQINRAIDAANERNLASFEQRAENIDTNNDLTAMRNYAALGGPLSMYSPYAFGVQGPLEYGLMMDDLDIKQQKADNAGESSLSGLTFGKGGGIHINPKNKGKLTATSKRTGKSFSELAHSKNPLTRKRAIFALNARHFNHHKHAFGGDLESNGANWDLGFTSIGNGGTHEMNPYEGVQMGMDSKGIPNLVEQGEIVYNDYVFSNRLNATPNLLQAYNLPKKYKGMTFSDIAAKISGETKERPNDPISQKGYEDQMERLIQAQETVRQAQQQKQAIQQAALMQQAQQYAARQQAQQQAYQNALAQQAYNNQQLGAMQGMVSSEEQMGLGQYGCGGGLKFARGGNLYGIGSWFKDMFGKTPSAKTYYPSYFGDENSWNELVPGFTDEEQNAEGFENPWTDEALKNFDFNTARMYMDAYQNGDEATRAAARKWINDNMKGMTMDQYNQLAALNPQTKMPAMPTTGRNAPMYSDVASLFINGFMGNKKDYANNIQAAADAAGIPERVEWNPLGDYVPPSYLDTQYMLNQLNSQFGATNRAAINNANGNRATAMANLLASQYNYGNQVGGLYRQAQEYNANQALERAKFNRETNLANSEGFLKADMANQAERRAGLNSKLQGTVYAQNMLNDNYYNWLSNMNKGIGNLMGDISSKAKENMAYNMLNFGKWNNYGLNPATGETIYLTGSPTTKTAAKGGYLTMPDRQTKRRKR